MPILQSLDEKSTYAFLWQIKDSELIISQRRVGQLVPKIAHGYIIIWLLNREGSDLNSSETCWVQRCATQHLQNMHR